MNQVETGDAPSEAFRRLAGRLAPLLAFALMLLWLLIIVVLIGLNTSWFGTLFGWHFFAHPIF